jgi:uncharacterized protein YbjT (DUF2867 family)
VEQLLGRIPAEQIGVSVRDPEQARGLAERGIRVRRGDRGRPASHRDRRGQGDRRRPDSLHQPHGREPVLTGSEAIDMAGAAEIAAELTGRPIRRGVVPEAEYRPA